VAGVAAAVLLYVSLLTVLSISVVLIGFVAAWGLGYWAAAHPLEQTRPKGSANLAVMKAAPSVTILPDREMFRPYAAR
jgi:hypothetical protein